MQNNTIFLSYSWVNREVADTIDNDFSAIGLQLTRDIRYVGYKQSIKAFIETIGRHDYVLMIISDEYLKSENCMYEVLELLNTHEFEKRILPISFSNVSIYKIEDRIYYYEYWQNKLYSAEQYYLKHKNLDCAEQFKRCENIKNSIDDFFLKVKDLNIFTFENLKKDNYQPLLKVINFVRDRSIVTSHPILNVESSKALILKIAEHYARLGVYKFVPHSVEEYTSSPFCQVIETMDYDLWQRAPDSYHNSITTVRSVSSSIDGRILDLQPLPLPGLFWIRRSQGYNNAPIIAHIHSYYGEGEKLFAVVAY